VLSSSYLRTEPRWAEDTRIHLVGPAQKLTLQIIGGPVCAIYYQGEYSYWQVRLSSNEMGWMAEGDLKEYYLARRSSRSAVKFSPVLKTRAKYKLHTDTELFETCVGYSSPEKFFPPPPFDCAEKRSAQGLQGWKEFFWIPIGG
jgi:hypothetical protein